MNGPRNHQKTELWQSMLEVLWLRLPGETKTYQARAVINNYAQGWRLRNVSLRIKHLCASLFRNLEGKQKRKNVRNFSLFLFRFVFFFSFSATANFWNRFWEEGWFLERKTRDRSNLLCRPDIFYVLLLLFYTRSSNSTRGRAQNRRESRQKEKTSRSMDVSMYARTYDALHFRYSRPL